MLYKQWRAISDTWHLWDDRVLRCVRINTAIMSNEQVVLILYHSSSHFTYISMWLSIASSVVVSERSRPILNYVQEYAKYVNQIHGYTCHYSQSSNISGPSYCNTANTRRSTSTEPTLDQRLEFAENHADMHATSRDNWDTGGAGFWKNDYRIIDTLVSQRVL